MKQMLKLTNDAVFQSVFGKVGNERITKGLIEKILGIEIDEKDISLDTNKRLIGKDLADKVGRIDVKARLKDGTKIAIEMQVVTYDYLIQRILYYWAQLYVSGLKKGAHYLDLKKTIVILIVVDNIKELSEIEEYHTEWKLREKKHSEKILTDYMEIHIIELNKFKEGAGNPEDNWLRLLKGESMEKVINMEKEIKEALDELDRLSADPEMAELFEAKQYDYREKMAMYDTGKREGKEERFTRRLD